MLTAVRTQDFLTGRDIPMMNENAIANLLMDVDFLDEELKRSGHSHSAAFTELRSVRRPSEFPTLIILIEGIVVSHTDGVRSDVRRGECVSCRIDPPDVIRRGKAQAPASAAREAQQIRSGVSRRPVQGEGREAEERGGGSRTGIPWGESLTVQAVLCRSACTHTHRDRKLYQCICFL